jgi:hypothetical protein
VGQAVVDLRLAGGVGGAEILKAEDRAHRPDVGPGTLAMTADSA